MSQKSQPIKLVISIDVRMYRLASLLFFTPTFIFIASRLADFLGVFPPSPT